MSQKEKRGCDGVVCLHSKKIPDNVRLKKTKDADLIVMRAVKQRMYVYDPNSGESTAKEHDVRCSVCVDKCNTMDS